MSASGRLDCSWYTHRDAKHPSAVTRRLPQRITKPLSLCLTACAELARMLAQTPDLILSAAHRSRLRLGVVTATCLVQVTRSRFRAGNLQ
jgi:hypothetical protein